MAQRCPACKMESADDAAWCDFCKEPFRKPAPAAARPVTAKEPPKTLPVDPDALLKAGDGETLPALPPWARGAAWAFLAMILLVAMMLGGAMYARQKAAAVDAESAPR